MAFSAVLWLALLLTALPALGATLSGQDVRAQAGTFVGGVQLYPRYLADDHTPAAVRVYGTGLTPNTTYVVKIRFMESSSPGGSTNRGFTWNPVTQQWPQERDAWTSFPTLTTDGSGAIPANTWFFVKIGDDTKAQDYYLNVAVQPTGAGSGSTTNGSIQPTATVMAMGSGGGTGSWIHNGVSSTLAAATQVVATPADQFSATLSLTKTEPNGCDDDNDGIVDNEHYSAASAGDFRMAVPASTAIDVRTSESNATLVNGWHNIVTGPADTDIAVGGSDMTPPSAPGPVTVTPAAAQLNLSWPAATDNVHVAGYYVYRWQDAPADVSYTSVHVRVAKVTSGTTWQDPSVTVGETYHYEVRAYDAATNVGPRSTTGSGSLIPGIPPAQITDLHTGAVTVATVPLLWTAPADDLGAGGAATLYDLRYSTSSIDDTATFLAATAAGGLPVPGAPGTQQTVTVTGLGTDTYYFALRSRDADGNWSAISNIVTASVIGNGTDTFVGGVDTPSLVCADDHTVTAVHLVVTSGLDPNTTYRVKTRYAEDVIPAAATDRGFVFNKSSTGTWAQEAADWASFPTFTTDASGGLPNGKWLYIKLGDDTKARDYHLMASVLPVGASTGTTTRSGTLLPIVTAMSMTSAGTGSWVHNAVPSLLATETRVAATSDSAPSTMYSLVRTEPNGVDDDNNGVIDDESHTSATAGDFRMAVPAATHIDVRTGDSNETLVQGWHSVLTGPPDTDIALGGSEMIPPTAPGTPGVTSLDGKLQLVWSPATDNVGVRGYYVYRWQDEPVGSPFTPAHVKVATVTPPTIWTDASVSTGQTYHYEVRAFDAAGNVGPRSPMGTGTAVSAPPSAVTDLHVTQAAASAVTVAWTAPATDNGSGTTVFTYDLRYSTSPITDLLSFAAANTVDSVPDPTAPGSTQSAIVTGLTKDTPYYFAIRSRDSQGSWSDISNVIQGTPVAATSVGRTAGASRFDTALQASQKTFLAGSAPAVVIASGRAYADALTGSGLAGAVRGPLLLTDSTASPALLAEVNRLGASTVYLVGGTGVVTQAVENSFKAAGKTVIRAAGANRYATAAEVAVDIETLGGATDRVLIANGTNFPDALAMAPLAYAHTAPILLVKPGSIPAETAKAINDIGATTGLIAGGTGAVSAGVETQLHNLLLDADQPAGLTRLGGADRYETASLIAKWAGLHGWCSWHYVGVATGVNFPDGLAGGATTGFNGGVMMLVKTTSVPSYTSALLTTNKAEIEHLEIFGGTGAVSQATQNALTTVVAP